MTCQQLCAKTSFLSCTYYPKVRRAKVEEVERRLTTLIFADRPGGVAGIVVIRRELPLTSDGSLVASDVSHRSLEDSPFRVPIDLRPPYPAMMTFLSRYAAALFSTVVPIAQMKPRSSLATAVITFCLHFSLAMRRM